MHFLILFLLGLALPALAQAQVPVEVQRLDTVLVDHERRAPADVRPLNDARIAAEVTAVVRTVAADVGQHVPAGGLLLEFDATDYELNLRQAVANLESSRAQKTEADAKLSRARELGENQYVSADELLERETRAMVVNAQIQTAEVAVAVARRNLEKCRVLAPFDGVVGERQAQVGSFVTIGSPLLRFTQLDQFEVDAEIPASVSASLIQSSDIEFISQGDRWPIRLLRLSPVINTERRSQRARLAFTDTSPAVGRSGEVVWRTGGDLLPSNLVSRRDGQLGLFIHRDGQAVFTPLPDAQEGRPVPVNLPGATEVIMLGRERLQHGDPVSIRRTAP